MIKHNSIYRGSLLTFQHYLNCYHSFLPLKNRLNNSKEYLYEIEEYYDNGILKKIKIELKDLKQKQGGKRYGK